MKICELKRQVICSNPYHIAHAMMREAQETVFIDISFQKGGKWKAYSSH